MREKRHPEYINIHIRNEKNQKAYLLLFHYTMQSVGNHISLLPLNQCLRQRWLICNLLKVCCFCDRKLQLDLFWSEHLYRRQWEDSLSRASKSFFRIWFLCFELWKPSYSDGFTSVPVGLWIVLLWIQGCTATSPDLFFSLILAPSATGILSLYLSCTCALTR